MTTQQYVPQRRKQTKPDHLGALTARLYGRGADDKQEAETRPAAIERLERRLRSSRLGWWLRRYGAIYPRLAALDDTDVAQTLGVCWLIYVVVTAIVSAVAGPWVIALAIPFGIAFLVATVLTVVWWMGYRRSGHQLRHQMLARDGFARGREVAEHVGALKVVDTVDTVRPVTAEAMRSFGRAATLHRQSHGQLRSSGPVSIPAQVRRPVVAAPTAGRNGRY